jgi:tetratricopeptide (TPR) repeat protein
MAHKFAKSIIVGLRIALGTILIATLSLLLNVIAGQLADFPWLKSQSWYTWQYLALGGSVCVVAIILVELWNQGASQSPEAATREDLDAQTREIVESFYDVACKGGWIPAHDLKAKEAEITRLTQELNKLQEQLAARSSEPAEAELSKLLAAGDLDSAFHVKSRQVEQRQVESEKLTHDLYELGIICELRFDWPAALANFRKAWELSKTPEYGFKYAYFAQRMNHFKEAIEIYEALLKNDSDSANRTGKLNNLAILYRGMQRMKEAEEAFVEALATYRKLAEANRDENLPDIASTINNLAILYRNTQRMKKAEEAYNEALATYRKLAEANPDAYLPNVAATLNNLAILHQGMQRMKEAEEAFVETLDIYRKLAKATPDAYLPNVAMTLNNLAVLYRVTQRIKEAEKAYVEALILLRKLAEVNPDSYLPNVAMTLNNLANLYSETQRMKEAEEAFVETLDIYRKLAKATSDAYLPNVAMTLNNLAVLYRATQRMKEAEKAYIEALGLRRKLAEANPDAYLPDVAVTLNNLAIFNYARGRLEEAEAHASEAEDLLDPLWRKNPELHGNDMARILATHALVSKANKGSADKACALTRRAFAAAYDPVLKESIQRDINRICTESKG